jgi:gluconokinase
MKSSAIDLHNQSLNIRIVVMGVSGCGKSTVGSLLAKRLGIRYIEGDQFHSPENLRKMGAGVPLTDEDRKSWLLELQSQLRAATRAEESVVMTCSALKRSYRDLLREADSELLFIHLVGTRDVIAARMQKRTGHFMPPALLESQLRDLEPPGPDERAFGFSIAMPLEQLVDQAVKAIQP